ncbi:MAG: SDR family oxidoreductase [Anaerolineaceae bacterium]|nr:SDR family oxidoreductase [Anaerolineaceae bacterium]
MSLNGKVAIVTGSAGLGMGSSIAMSLARENAKVVINYRSSRNRADEIVALLKSEGKDALAVQADVFTEQGCRKLVNETIDAFGWVDICVVSPGAGWHPEKPGELNVEGALEDLHHEVAPLYYLMPLVLPKMYERGWGRLIGITLNLDFLSPSFAYNAAKAARLNALVLAEKDAWPHGVTVNAIAPGPVGASKNLAQSWNACNHGRSWGKRENVLPQDIAEMVAYLCSDAGQFISGAVIPFRFA